VVSSLLGFMAVSGCAGWMNIRGIRVTVAFPDEIYDGIDTLVIVRLENRKMMMPSFLLRVDAGAAAVGFNVIEKQSVESDALTLRFSGRGKRVLEKVQVSSAFPINFFVRGMSVPLHAGFTVFPAPRFCNVPEGPGPREARGEASSQLRGYGGDLAKIRDYTGTEPLKLIHWRLSARHQELKVKELTAPAETPLVLDVLSLPGGSLDERMSSGAFLVNRAIRAGIPVGLKLAGRLIRPDTTRTHRLRLLTELAEYGKR
jgi:uncharacterized protein (DUF58 family)